MSKPDPKDDKPETIRYFAAKRRRPRFRPVEGQRGETASGNISRAGAFVLTDRDREIMVAVAKHRFLNSDQVARLFPSSAGGEGRAKRRLTELFHAGLLERPVRQRELVAPMSGGFPFVYAMSAKGARMLIDEGKLPQAARRRDWSAQNTEASRIYIAHTLGLSDLRIALEESVKQHADVTLQHDRDMAGTIPRDFQKYPGRSFSMTVPIIQDGERIELAVDPDAAFKLDLTNERKRAHYLVEVDLDTMPVMRWKRATDPKTGKTTKVPSLRGTSMMRKFVAYERAREIGLHKTLFDWALFKVIVLTTSTAHLKTMQDAIATMNNGKGSNLFLLGVTKDACAGDILRYPFLTANGNTETLLP